MTQSRSRFRATFIVCFTPILLVLFLAASDRVSEGELLAQLDTSEQRAELRRAMAEEERARLEYERMRELRDRDNVSAAEYQRARADLQIAESERELWQARVNFGRIKAPREAVVTARLIEPGEAVNAQDTLFERGETVLVSNPIDMRDGQRVRIVQRRSVQRRDEP